MSTATETIMEVEAVVERLKALRKALFYSRDEQANWRRDEIRSITRELAMEFGRRHGWQLCHSEFTLACLAKRGGINGGWRAQVLDWSALDHPYYFRDGRRAAAIAAHLYSNNWAEQMPKLSAWAECYGLRASFPTDFPSWYYPDGTKLVVYEPDVLRGIEK
jgi:hypothetical protein